MTTTQLRMTFEETPPGKTYSAPSVPTASEQLLAPTVAVVTGPAKRTVDPSGAVAAAVIV